MSEWRRITIRMGPITSAELEQVRGFMEREGVQSITDADVIRFALSSTFSTLARQERDRISND